DETASPKQLADVRLHLESAGRSVERLREAEGISGFSQRSDKFDLQHAPIAQSAPAPAFGGGEAARTMKRNLAGPGALSAQAAAGGYGPALRGSNTYRAIDSDNTIVCDGIQDWRNETL